MSQAYDLAVTSRARRALTDGLPHAVATAAVEFITGPLVENPQRVGKPLREQLAGICSARLGREWRVLYEIDEAKHTVTVLDIRHRASAYRPR
ncbi:type II toxin-antitoxin system RelE/ParE family toxin [Actinopolymorpha sp. B17G11]|uniref:type II toxin-antitoxin system RelE family toxin n=1 Tax=unclassified Actinopolymorpha TaxID=2627063 RepID=UPI0032D8EF2C